MDKTQNISLGGLAFQIDDAAFKILNKYLRDIRLSLGNSSGVDEIITDVEYRMAELLRQRMMVREVVNVADVDYLISVMGAPEEFYNEEFLDDEQTNDRTYKSSNYHEKQSKKLFRDPDDKILGGVCSGLAHYFGVDRVWVRLALILLPFLDFLFLGISTGSIILVYFILWVVVPEAKTTSEKLQMRGEPVNFDSIKDFFGNSPEVVRNNLNDINDEARRVANNSGNVIGNLFRILIKVFIIFIIALIIISSLGLIIGLLGSLFGLGIAGLGLGVSGIAYGDQLSYLFDDGWEKVVAFISLGAVLLIPVVGLILLAMRLISDRYKVPRYIGFMLPLVWFLGFIGLLAVGTITATKFKYTDQEIKTVNIPTDASTIVLERIGDRYNSYDLDDLFNVKADHLAIPIDDDISVKESTTGNSYLELKFTSRGFDREKANDAIKDATYYHAVEDSLVMLDDYLFIEDGKQWRNQYVKPTLYLASDKKVTFKNFDDIDVEEGGNTTWYSANSEKIYKFDNNHFQCINCPSFDEETEETNETESITGVIKISNGEDSIIIKKQSHDTSSHTISDGNDSISD